MNGMPGTQTIRLVKITSRVEATVTATVPITDDQVREWLNLGPDDDVDWESVEEYALEETDESMYDLHSIDTWESNEVVLISTERRHISPPEFVALPGMESI